jgi:uncharacterized protein YbaP (TraB family)
MHLSRPIARFCRLSTLGLACLAFASLAFAADHHSLWKIQGKNNSVYLLGSMHLLRANEPLPAVMDEAYRDAATLVMEIDMDDLDPSAAQRLTKELGLLPPGETLPDQLTSDAAAKLVAYTQRLGIPAAMLNQYRPWLAAITLTQLHMMKLGLDSQSGIEQRLASKAMTDRKEILGLETIDEQLGMLARLPPKLQTAFLVQTLAEADQVETEIDKMIAAWRAGDTVALEKFLLSVQESPEIYRTLIVDRNRRWLTRLTELLNARQDYLVIVGAMHLVGKDGVLELLEQRGYKVVQH